MVFVLNWDFILWFSLFFEEDEEAKSSREAALNWALNLMTSSAQDKGCSFTLLGLTWFSYVDSFVMTSCFPVRVWCTHTPLGGSKSMHCPARFPLALGENEMRSPEHDISFPVILFYSFASCVSFSLTNKPTAFPIAIVMDHRENNIVQYHTQP